MQEAQKRRLSMGTLQQHVLAGSTEAKSNNQELAVDPPFGDGSSNGNEMNSDAVTHLDDWAEHWPFPEFRSKKSKAALKRGDGYEEIPTVISPGDMDSSSDEEESTGGNRPRSTNWLKKRGSEYVGLGGAGGGQHRVHFSDQGKKMSLSDENVSMSGVSAGKNSLLSENRNIRPATASASSGRRGLLSALEEEGKKGIGRNEAMSLMSAAELGKHGSMALDNVDLTWLFKRRGHEVTPPTLYLHLANMKTTASMEDLPSNHVLINSPRSALVLMRNGVAARDLLQRGHPPEDDGVKSIRDLSWKQRKELAVEKSRKVTFRKLHMEYAAVSRKSSFEEVVEMCKGYSTDVVGVNASKRSSHSSSNSISGHSSASRLVDEARDRYNHSISSHSKNLSQISRSQAAVLRDIEERRAKTVASIQRKEKQVKEFQQLKKKRDELRCTITEGQSELWNDNRKESNRADAFRALVVREQQRQRTTEADSAKDIVRQMGITHSNQVLKCSLQTAAHNERVRQRYISKAKQHFFEHQY